MPGFLIGTKPFTNKLAKTDPNINPRDSIPATYSNAGNSSARNKSNSTEVADSQSEVHAKAEGVTSVGEIVENPDSYSKTTLRIQGRVTKVNNNIMGLNWLHLDDGTNDGYDFVVTTSEIVEIDDVVTMEGSLSLNKDFGAGYFYAIILENCKRIQ